MIRLLLIGLLTTASFAQTPNLTTFLSSNGTSTGAIGTIKGYIGQPILATSSLASVGAIRTGYVFVRNSFVARPTSSPEQPNPTISEFALGQNYPNPFNPSTVIPFSLDHAGDAQLAIYNLLGQQVRAFEFPAAQPGAFSVTWDGKANNGATVPSGEYFARLAQDSRMQVRKLTLIK
ncbi:MAG: T9SS type A sorting domain-containing protein [Calditrichaeota bacterium]|nr:T9SS type A sorting domain-containing protein [Calditrichota bacterium]MCB9367227.1 T9SS type A sorting domain-containing protein [Calditrichota bacterium]MCB9391784.1 T9SS type A sorting domain-containing protein [Calditrichota bacterium]